MPPHRNNEPWELDEIELVDRMLQVDTMSIPHIARSLRRSEMAVKHAISKIIYQQLLDHTPAEIAERYNRDLSWIRYIVDPKYNINYDNDNYFNSNGDDAGEGEDAAGEEGDFEYVDGEDAVGASDEDVPEQDNCEYVEYIDVFPEVEPPKILENILTFAWWVMNFGVIYYAYTLHQNGFGQPELEV
jgi:hypothetical protein